MKGNKTIRSCALVMLKILFILLIVLSCLILADFLWFMVFLRLEFKNLKMIYKDLFVLFIVIFYYWLFLDLGLICYRQGNTTDMTWIKIRNLSFILMNQKLLVLKSIPFAIYINIDSYVTEIYIILGHIQGGGNFS